MNWLRVTYQIAATTDDVAYPSTHRIPPLSVYRGRLPRQCLFPDSVKPNDDPAKAQACFALFQRAATNEIALTTAEAVIAEVVYILSSKKLYHLTPGDIKLRLYPLLSLRGLKLPQKVIYLRALDYYAFYHLDFEDCLTVAQMEHQVV